MRFEGVMYGGAWRGVIKKGIVGWGGVGNRVVLVVKVGFRGTGGVGRA